MIMSNKKTKISKSTTTGHFSVIHPKGFKVFPSVSKERAVLAERAVRDFYAKHGDAMTTLAYE